MPRSWLLLSLISTLIYRCQTLTNPYDYNTSPRDPYDVVEDRFLVRFEATDSETWKTTILSAIDIFAYRHEDHPELFLSTPTEEFEVVGCNDFDFHQLILNFRYPFGHFTFEKTGIENEGGLYCFENYRTGQLYYENVGQIDLDTIDMKIRDDEMDSRDQELWQTRAKFLRYGKHAFLTYATTIPKSWFEAQSTGGKLSECSPDFANPGFTNWCDTPTCWYHVDFTIYKAGQPATDKPSIKCPVMFIFDSNFKGTNIEKLSQIKALYVDPTYPSDVKVYRNDGHRIHGPVNLDLAAGILRVFHRPKHGQSSATFEFGHGIGVASPGYRFYMIDEHNFSLKLFNDDNCRIEGRHNGTEYEFTTATDTTSIKYEKNNMFILFFHKDVVTIVSSTEFAHKAVKFCDRVELKQSITTLTVDGSSDVDFVIYPHIVFIERNPPKPDLSAADEDEPSEDIPTTPASKEIYVSMGVFLGVIIIELILLIITCIAAPILRYKYDRKKEQAEAPKPLSSKRVAPPPSVFAVQYKESTPRKRKNSSENVKPLIPPETEDPKNPSREMMTSQAHQTLAQNTVDPQAAPIDYNVLARTWMLPQDFWSLFPVESTLELPVLALEGDVRNESIFFFLRDVTAHEDAMFNHVETRLNESGADFGPMPTIYREKDIPQSEFNLRDPFTVIRAFVVGHAPLHLELYFTGIVPHFISQISPNCSRCKNDANKSFLITDAVDLKTIVENLPHGYHLRVAISDHHDLSVTSKRTTVFAIRFGMPFELPSVVHYASLYHRNTQNRKQIASNKIPNYREGLKALVKVPGPAPSSISAALKSKKASQENADPKDVDFLVSASLDDPPAAGDGGTKASKPKNDACKHARKSEQSALGTKTNCSMDAPLQGNGSTRALFQNDDQTILYKRLPCAHFA
uniref:CUB domain-containing protein n=1 Tax=Panagrellus redivivus TaxID=6233 RepID=A0A7E4VYV7_PANRE